MQVPLRRQCRLMRPYRTVWRQPPTRAGWFYVNRRTILTVLRLSGCPCTPPTPGDTHRRAGYLGSRRQQQRSARSRSTEEEDLLRIGKITVGSLNEWTLTPGTVTSWHPTAAAAERVRQAPVSSVPVSYMQGQHLRNYCQRTAEGLSFSRQIIGSCDVPGRCDISAMDQALNAYLRRHDTFRSWFEHTGDGEFVRHAISDPAGIEFAPINHGHMAVDQIRAHVVAIPNPLEWGCFTFGIIQTEHYFTLFAAMDHLHGD